MKLDFDGEKYKRASAQQKTWGKGLISELELAGHERILDLGCGDGALTVKLAELVPDGLVLGIDASESMIATAKKYHNGANVRFERLDINIMDFEPDFDVVFSNATLHWIKDHKRLLRKVFECLKDRGTARFQFAGDGNCPNFIQIVSEVMAESSYVDSFCDFEWPWYMPTCREYQTLLDEVPFMEKKVWSTEGDKYFETSEAMTGWIDQPCLVPFLGCLAERDRRAFRNAVVERMIARTQQNDGTYLEKFRRINVWARK